MKILTVPVEEREKLAQDAADAPGLLDMLQGFPVANDAALGVANELLREILIRKDALEARLDRATAPLKEALNEIRSWFKEPLSQMTACERILRDKIGAHLSAQKTAREELHLLAQRSQVAGDIQTTVNALNAAGAPVNIPQGTSHREIWDYEIVCQSAIPRTYMQPNLELLRKHVRSFKPGETPTPIDGIRFKLKPIVSVRRN